MLIFSIECHGKNVKYLQFVLSNTWNSSGSGSSRREGTRSQYFEESNSESDEIQLPSVSSRGRVRKISSKVRGFFCERN